MKTITQLRTELREAAEHIELLSQELAQLQPNEPKKGLDFTHIQTIGKRYPILNHCLAREDADFRQQYLTLLVAPLLLESPELAAPFPFPIFAETLLLSPIRSWMPFLQLWWSGTWPMHCCWKQFFCACPAGAGRLYRTGWPAWQSCWAAR